MSIFTNLIYIHLKVTNFDVRFVILVFWLKKLVALSLKQKQTKIYKTKKGEFLVYPVNFIK